MSPDKLRLETAYIGVGSNLDDPQRQVLKALSELNAIPDTHCVRRSSLYASPPMGPPDQPDYINAVAMIQTTLSAHMLLDALLMLEKLHGRVRNGERWGPRSLDLDVLLYGSHAIGSERLSVPHPGIAERAFVLYPLQEVCEDLEIPGLGMLVDLVNACPLGGLRRLATT